MHQFIIKVNTSSLRHTNTKPYQLLYDRYAVWWIIKLPRNNGSENIYSSCFYIFCKPGIPLASLCSLRASVIASGHQAQISCPVCYIVIRNIQCLSNAFQQLPPLFWYIMHHLPICNQSLLQPDWPIALRLQI